MQSPAFQITGPLTHNRLYYIRLVVSGLFLLALLGLYFVLVYPVAQAEVPPSNYRFPFSFITLIYAVDLAVLGIEYFYRLARPPQPAPPRDPITKLDVVGMVLRFGLLLSIGGSYVTGAAIATPAAFSPVLPTWLVGASVPIFADFLHSLFASLIVGIGSAIVVYEVAKIATHRSTWSNWLGKGRYPEIKVLYWILAISVITTGILGLFLLGTFTPIGPFGLLGLNSYNFETLVRHIHGPLGAFIFAIFTNHIYYRIRPEYSIR
jgi:hypothetical protein